MSASSGVYTDRSKPFLSRSTSEPASSAWNSLPTSSKLAGAIARVSPS
jgi:hypothetical protein